jgi:ribosome biogenesis GTPase A
MSANRPLSIKSEPLLTYKDVQVQWHICVATAKATPMVCTTKSMTGIKINENPLFYLVDSPGVMIPSNISDDIGLKLGCLGLIRDVILDKQIMVEYMIELFNSQNNDRYFTSFKLTKPNDAMDYLLKVRKKFGFHNYEAAWDHILDALREGGFGPITFDKPEESC